MEVFILAVLFGIICAILASCLFLDKATNFFKSLKSKTAKLFRGFEFKLSVVPTNKKSEECADNTTSPKRDLE